MSSRPIDNSATRSLFPKIDDTCRNCQKIASNVCGKCLSAPYCSKNCQEKAWNDVHHLTCDKLKFLQKAGMFNHLSKL